MLDHVIREYDKFYCNLIHGQFLMIQKFLWYCYLDVDCHALTPNYESLQLD